MGKQTKHIDHNKIKPDVVKKLLFCDELIGNSKKNKTTLFRTRIFTYVLIIFIITGEESNTLCELCKKNLTSEKCGLCGSLTCENCIDFRDEDNLDESKNQIYCSQCGKEGRKGTKEERDFSDSK